MQTTLSLYYNLAFIFITMCGMCTAAICTLLEPDTDGTWLQIGCNQSTLCGQVHFIDSCSIARTKGFDCFLSATYTFLVGSTCIYIMLIVAVTTGITLPMTNSLMAVEDVYTRCLWMWKTTSSLWLEVLLHKVPLTPLQWHSQICLMSIYSRSLPYSSRKGRSKRTEEFQSSSMSTSSTKWASSSALPRFKLSTR